MRTDIGNIMSATAILQKQMESPVQLLRKEVDIMRSELIWYEKKHPDFDTSKKRERLYRLEMIIQSLKACEPLSIMSTIHSKLAEAAKHKFDPDCACVWLPLKYEVLELVYASPAIIDLVGWDILTPYDNNYVGIGNAGGYFVCSNTDEGGMSL